MTWWKNHLDLNEKSLSVGFCGAGGKTTCLWELSEELIKNHKKVLITTTTKMYPYYQLAKKEIVIRETFNQNYFVDLDRVQWFGKINSENKGCSPELEAIEKSNKNTEIWKLIEIDGSKNMPIKAPRAGEPVFLKNMDLVFGLISLEVLGKAATTKTVHNMEGFLALTGLNEGDPISLKALEKLIESPMGLFQGKPENTQAVVLLNQVREYQLADVTALSQDVSVPVTYRLYKEAKG